MCLIYTFPSFLSMFYILEWRCKIRRWEKKIKAEKWLRWWRETAILMTHETSSIMLEAYWVTSFSNNDKKTQFLVLLRLPEYQHWSSVIQNHISSSMNSTISVFTKFDCVFSLPDNGRKPSFYGLFVQQWPAIRPALAKIKSILHIYPKSLHTEFAMNCVISCLNIGSKLSISAIFSYFRSSEGRPTNVAQNQIISQGWPGKPTTKVWSETSDKFSRQRSEPTNFSPIQVWA